MVVHGFCVSTHSRPKAAACMQRQRLALGRRFNTQPPEGGCVRGMEACRDCAGFNTQPPEGGCRFGSASPVRRSSFNTQPPEGGCVGKRGPVHALECFNTQPPEGGCERCPGPGPGRIRFNTQPPEGGCMKALMSAMSLLLFQHTAARRRLPTPSRIAIRGWGVSTHSRPKAAARGLFCERSDTPVSTHSRPKAAAQAAAWE